LWSVADHIPIGPAVVTHLGGVNAVAVRSDGQRVVSVGAGDLQVKTWAVTPTWAPTARDLHVDRDRLVRRLPGRSAASIAVGEWNGAVQVLDADTLAPRADVGSNGNGVNCTRRRSRQVLPMNDGGFTSVGLDGWVKRLTGGFAVFSTRRAAEATPLAAAVDPATGVTAIASADGTLSSVDPTNALSSAFGVKLVESDSPVAVRRLVRCRPGRHRSVRAAAPMPPVGHLAVVSLRAVDQDGRLRAGALAKSGNLSNVALSPRSVATNYAVADYTGVIAPLPRHARDREPRPGRGPARHDCARRWSRSSMIVWRSSRDQRGDHRHQQRQAPQGPRHHRPEPPRSPPSLRSRAVRASPLRWVTGPADLRSSRQGKQVDHTMTDVLSTNVAVSPIRR